MARKIGFDQTPFRVRGDIAAQGKSMVRETTFGTTITMTDAEFVLLRSLMYEQSGVHLAETKRQLLIGRLAKRLRHYGYEEFAQYYDHLKTRDPQGAELQEMINAVTTHKTAFFRESHHFDCLREQLLIPAGRAAAEGRRAPIRIWSAGCSSGEEPYSIAITIAANLERINTWDVKILGSDIDTDVLERARAAIYPRESVSDLPLALLRRNFRSGHGEYSGYVQLKPEVRKLVKFGRLNLVEESWPFRAKFDAIFCRNVMIYFDRDVQRYVLGRFAEYLKPGGLFFAGHSENLFWLGDAFQPIGGTAYRVGGVQGED
jgi:chemotaxis protein methyltransferase CheR